MAFRKRHATSDISARSMPSSISCDLADWDASIEINPQTLAAAGKVKQVRDGIKILGGTREGRRCRRAWFSATSSSRRSAREALSAAGARFEEVEASFARQSTRRAWTVPDIRKRIGFVFFAFAVFVYHDPRSDPGRQRAALAAGALARDVLQVPRLSLGRRVAAALDHRHGDHAVHQRVDHHAADDGRAPAARRDGKARRRGRPQEDQPLHALVDDRARNRSRRPRCRSR